MSWGKVKKTIKDKNLSEEEKLLEINKIASKKMKAQYDSKQKFLAKQRQLSGDCGDSPQSSVNKEVA